MRSPHRNELCAELRSVRRSLSALDSALCRLAKSIGTATLVGSTAPARRKLTISPARRAALKLQGQYMGQIRDLKPKQKAEVKAVKAKRGIEAAIRLARRLGQSIPQR